MYSTYIWLHITFSRNTNRWPSFIHHVRRSASDVNYPTTKLPFNFARYVRRSTSDVNDPKTLAVHLQNQSIIIIRFKTMLLYLEKRGHISTRWLSTNQRSAIISRYDNFYLWHESVFLHENQAQCLSCPKKNCVNKLQISCKYATRT